MTSFKRDRIHYSRLKEDKDDLEMTEQWEVWWKFEIAPKVMIDEQTVLLNYNGVLNELEWMLLRRKYRLSVAVATYLQQVHGEHCCDKCQQKLTYFIHRCCELINLSVYSCMLTGSQQRARKYALEARDKLPRYGIVSDKCAGWYGLQSTYKYMLCYEKDSDDVYDELIRANTGRSERTGRCQRPQGANQPLIR